MARHAHSPCVPASSARKAAPLGRQSRPKRSSHEVPISRPRGRFGGRAEVKRAGGRRRNEVVKLEPRARGWRRRRRGDSGGPRSSSAPPRLKDRQDVSAGEPPAGLRRGALRAASLPECGRSRSLRRTPGGVALRAGAARHSNEASVLFAFLQPTRPFTAPIGSRGGAKDARLALRAAGQKRECSLRLRPHTV